MTRRVVWYHSLRLRIALTVGLVAILSVLVVGFVVDRQAGIDARERLRAQALSDLNAAATLYGIDGRLHFGASVDPSLPPPSLRAAVAHDGTASYFDGTTMWAAKQVTSRVVMTVALPAATLQHQRDQLRSSMVVAGGIAVLLAGALGWLAATGLSSRLRSAADAVARGDAAPVTRPGKDEVAALTRAVDDATASLAERLRAEQEFSANVAHELRTPTTGLVSAVELLPPSPESQLVGRQVQRLRALVDDLLEISRLESGQDEAVLQRVDSAELVGDREASVLRSSTVLAEPRRVERILSNLVANADAYAGGHRILVDGERLIVEDDGPGYPNELLASGPRRFSGRGTGLGLTIALRQAQAMGAALELENRAEGGARATVRFLSTPENGSP